MTSANEELLYEVKDEIGLITLNRPQARNALTFAMYEGIADICANAPTDGSVKVIIIRGAGDKAFAAGTDISQFRSFETPEQGLAYEEKGEVNFNRIASCPLPVIAAICGACTGGGAGIASACDIRIASADLKFGFPIARTLGNTLSARTLARLVGLLGEAKVVDLIFKSRLMGSEEALQSGLVSEVLPDCDAVMARAFELAEQLKLHAPLTMRSIKTILRRLREAQPKAEDKDLIAAVYTSADFKEGMDAFLTKRKPNWQGR